MINYKKIIAGISAIGMCFSFAACSDNEESVPGKELSAEEINSQYEELMSSSEETPETLPEDYNPIVDSFTSVDFQFTTTDDTVAFNIPENSYTRITPSGAIFNFINSENEGETFEGEFKTAKGFSLVNTKDEFIASYKIAPDYLCYPAEGITAFGFFTVDGLNYSVMSPSQVQTVLDMKNSMADNAEIAASVPDAQTVSVIELASDEAGTMSEYTIWRFDVSVAPEDMSNQS